jgi:uncharacterized protein (DUF58 family)
VSLILPTRRAVWACAAIAPLGLLGFLNPGALDLMLALDAILALLVAVDGWHAPDPRVLTVRRLAPAAFSLGREGAVSYEWHNPLARPARLLVRELRPGRVGGLQPPREIAVPARGTARERLPVMPRARGRETAGSLTVRSLGRWGLAQRHRRLDVPWSVVVFPALPGASLRAAVAAAARRQPGLRPERRAGEGRLFESLREWVPGDDTRTIDWKATARRQKVIARRYEEERRQQVMLLLDAGRLLAAEVAGASRLEYAVRAALDLAFAARHHDDDVGLMIFADRVLRYVPPQRGQRGLRAVLDALADADPVMVEPDYPAAFRYLAVRNRKRSLTVLLGDVIDRMASEALVSAVRSLRPRHLPLAVTLRNPDLDAVAHLKPAVPRDAWRKAAAEELLAARQEALAVMRGSGVMVLDVPPQRAAQAVVGAYLELKRRGRL